MNVGNAMYALLVIAAVSALYWTTFALEAVKGRDDDDHKR